MQNSLAVTGAELHRFGRLTHQTETKLSAYRQYVRTTELMKLICHLTRSMQIHRGMTMGWLSGQPAFYPQIVEQQRLIDVLLLIIRDVEWPIDDGRSESEVRHLTNDWQTILDGWRDDQLLHNFEFHSHLIDGLLRLLRVDLQSTLVTQFTDSQTETPILLPMCTEHLPDFTEILAKLRGLATNVAVHKNCDSQRRERLVFLCREAKSQYRKIRAMIKSSGAEVRLPAAFGLHFKQNLNAIEKNLLQSEAVEVASTELFRSASQFIDELWEAADYNILGLEMKLAHALLSSSGGANAAHRKPFGQVETLLTSR